MLMGRKSAILILGLISLFSMATMAKMSSWQSIPHLKLQVVAREAEEKIYDEPLISARDFFRPRVAIYPTSVLRALIRDHDQTYTMDYAQQVNQFCFVHQRFRGDTPSFMTWLYWKNGGRIFSIYDLPHYTKKMDNSDIENIVRALSSFKPIALDTGVVEHTSDIRGSSYLVDLPWVVNLIQQCEQKGLRVILKPIPNKSPIN